MMTINTFRRQHAKNGGISTISALSVSMSICFLIYIRNDVDVNIVARYEPEE